MSFEKATQVPAFMRGFVDTRANGLMADFRSCANLRGARVYFPITVAADSGAAIDRRDEMTVLPGAAVATARVTEAIMSVLDRLIPNPALRDTDGVEVAVNADRAWDVVRQLDLAQSTLVRTLFAIRTIPDRLQGKRPKIGLRLDDLTSTPDCPGFQVLAEDPPREVAVGAIGKVWRPAIPFVHVPDAEAFAGFSEKGYVKVAWTLRVVPESDAASRVEFELRVGATDEEAWKNFTHYFRLIEPGSRFIRRVLLAQLERDLGTPESEQNNRVLPGDEVIPDAAGQFTHSVVIAAPPARIWPWLVQMGCRRAGFYSLDALDNAGVRSAHDIHLDLQQLRIGDRIPATPDGDDHFEVLRDSCRSTRPGHRGTGT
jgi:hypothetical protein